MSILQYFNGTPRDGQVYALTEMERHWNDYDVFVLDMPVGSGKSKVAECLAFWLKANGMSSSIITPTNVLINQYERGLKTGVVGLKDIRNEGLGFSDAKGWLKGQPIKLLNYYAYMAYKAYSDVLIIDEAHNTIPFLQEHENVKLWSHQWKLPENMSSVLELLSFIEGSKEPKLKKLRKMLLKNQDEYSLRWDTELYRGKERKVLNCRNLTPRHNAPILWPPSIVKKMVLMSATFGPEDLYDIGLDRRRIKYIETPSPIPKDRRPIIYEPAMGMSNGRNDEPMREAILELLDKKSGRGLIHTTYSLSNRWKVQLKHPRLLFHDTWDKDIRLKLWQSEHMKGGVLMACGLTEGLDLAYDKARWQAIAKIGYLNLGDPAVYAKAKSRPAWYQWQAVKDVLQASGRVCRAPDDYGETFILDANFAKLYNSNNEMWPSWFKESLR